MSSQSLPATVHSMCEWQSRLGHVLLKRPSSCLQPPTATCCAAHAVTVQQTTIGALAFKIRLLALN